MGTLTELKTKAEESLSKERKTEMEAQHAYELLKQSIEMELSTMQKRMSAATSERSVGLQLSSKCNSFFRMLAKFLANIDKFDVQARQNVGQILINFGKR